MLPRSQRLSRAEFTSLSSSGKRIHSPHLSGVLRESEEPGFAFVVSKKHAGGNVARNKLRRQAYNILKELSVKKKGILFAKKGIGTLSFDDLAKEIKGILGA